MVNNCSMTKQLLIKSNKSFQISQIKSAALFLKYIERSYLIEFILVNVFSFPQYMSSLLHNPFTHAKSRKYRLTLVRWRATMINCTICTGKYLSGVVILASINPQYDNRLYISSSVHENSNLRTCCVHIIVFCFCLDIQNNLCTQQVLSLEFSCTELVIQWTIFCHIVGYVIQE